MKVYLIRHGETDWNQEGRFQGREDIPLNEAGIAQAAVCGEALQGLGITSVYVSPLKRALRTGEEIAARMGLDTDRVYPMQELIERDLGPFSGQCVKDRKEYFALAAGDGVPGMEPFDEVLARMQQALRLLDRMGQQAVAAVSHGASINVLLAGLSNHEIGTGKTKLHNGGISVIEGNERDGFWVSHCNLTPEDIKKIVL
jgi:broad specificity phosphatase PhoE